MPGAVPYDGGVGPNVNWWITVLAAAGVVAGLVLLDGCGSSATPALRGWVLADVTSATLTPDPLHSAFYDSHPPAAIRIARLKTT